MSNTRVAAPDPYAKPHPYAQPRPTVHHAIDPTREEYLTEYKFRYPEFAHAAMLEVEQHRDHHEYHDDALTGRDIEAQHDEASAHDVILGEHS